MFSRRYAYLIAGLGNPGVRYECTRHNAGFLCVDKLADMYAKEKFRHGFDSLICDADIGGGRCVLCKPQTFMNRSGTAVSEICRFFKLETGRVIVVLDDVMLPPGKIRVRPGGSSGGHNGLKDVIESLGTEEIARVRIGVGRKPSPQYDLSDWVLGKIPDGERRIIEAAAEKAAEAVECIVTDSVSTAMNRYNG